MEKFKKFCLRMAEIVSKPRFSVVGAISIALLIFAAMLWVTVKFDSVIPLAIFLVIAVMVAVPATIGAFIRDRQR